MTTQRSHPSIREAYEMYYDDLVRVAWYLCRSTEEAEDVVQELFTSLLVESGDPLHGVQSVRGFLIVATRNRVLDRLRRHSRWFKLSRGLPVREDVPAAGELHHDAQCALRALDELPRMQREVFILRYIADLSGHETADALGISEGAVKTHASRAVDKLAAFLLPTGQPPE